MNNLNLTVSSPPIHPQGNGDNRPGAVARREIDAASANGDIESAFAAFDQAVTNGDPLQPHSCNVLLHLCAGGNVSGIAYEKGQDDDTAQKAVIPDRNSIHSERANKVFNHMVSNDIQRTEMTYTALARVEAAAGEPRRAFDVAKRLPAERLRPKLRTLAPALHAFCEAGDIDGALEVDRELTKHDIELTEAEFTVLLKARRVRKEFPEGLEIIQRASESVKTFCASLADECSLFFKDMPGWSVAESVTIDDTSGAGEAVFNSGTTQENKHIQLRAMHLSENDRFDLLAGIGKLSRERESADHFDGFVRWLKRRGPLPYLVDGANAGMYNQNFSGSGFNFNQVEKVMGRLRGPSKASRGERVAALKASREGGKEEGKLSKSNGKEETDVLVADTTRDAPAETTPATEEVSSTATKEPKEPKATEEKKTPVTDAEILQSASTSTGANCPVVFLHVRRVRGGPANVQRAKDTLEMWKRNGELFTTPAGSNDDWYWLYAAVASGKFFLFFIP